MKRRSGKVRKKISEAKWSLDQSERKEAFDLWVNGRTYDFIADKFQVSKSSIFKICKMLSNETGLKKSQARYLAFRRSEEYKEYISKHRLSTEQKNYLKKYRSQNKESIQKIKKDYYEKNKKKIGAMKKVWYQNIPIEIRKDKNHKYYKKNIERIKEYSQRPEVKKRQSLRNQREDVKVKKKEYRLKNLKKIRELGVIADRNRRQKDPLYKLVKNTQARFRNFLKHNRLTKIYRSSKIMDLVGCNADELKAHLESQFYKNKKTGKMMSWKNYGKWHVDHVIPLKYYLDNFNYEYDLAIQKKAWNFKNLQPLWANENIAKRDKYNKNKI